MVAPDTLMESPMERSASKDKNPTNGNETQTTDKEVVNEEVQKQPSYVALACCISGYTTLSYDSKQRQGLRSRPVSPIRVEGVQNASYTSECGNFLSPVPKELNPKMQTQGKGIDILNGCGGLHSPRRVANMTLTQDGRNYKSSIVKESYSSFNSSTTRYSYSGGATYSSSSTTTNNTTSEKTNGSRLITPTNIAEQLPPTSFIMQRVERLYGPGALAQGFYTLRKGTSNSSRESSPKVPVVQSTGLDKNEDSLPVLKLLRPEFRAQLTVANRKQKATTPDQASSLNEDLSMDKKTGQVIDTTTAHNKTEAMIRDEVKDGQFYLTLLAEQVGLLESLAARAEKELETCENEEVGGILRAGAGKARLLIAQKLNQFRGLCQKNIQQSCGEDFPTTNEDLAGFWDMVMIQVNDVLLQFDKINELRKNNWKSSDHKSSPPARTVREASTKKVSQKKIAEHKDSPALKARDEARKKLIDEKRKALKERKDKPNSDVLLL